MKKSQVKPLIKDAVKTVLKEHFTLVYPAKKPVNESEEDELEQEFLKWIKKSQPGLNPNDLAYDVAKEAFEAGVEVGISYGRSYGHDDVRKGYVKEQHWSEYDIRDMVLKLVNLKSEEEAYKMVWMWVKQNRIKNVQPFIKLIKIIEKMNFSSKVANPNV